MLKGYAARLIAFFALGLLCAPLGCDDDNDDNETIDSQSDSETGSVSDPDSDSDTGSGTETEAETETEDTDTNTEMYPTEDLWPEVESLIVGDSMFVVCFGTDKDFRDRFNGTHSFYVQNGLDQTYNYQQIKESNIDEVPYGILNYTASDPTNVQNPEQNNVICIGTMLMYDWENYWHWYEDYNDYEDFKFNMAMKMLDRAEADLAVDFASHIEFMEVFTPLTMQGFSLNPKGSIFGWAMIPEQSIGNRMPQQTPIDNLLLAGAWTYPGGGQSVSIISGMLAGIQILKKDGVPVPEVEPHDPPLRGINAEWFDNLGIRDGLEIECSEYIYNSLYTELCKGGNQCEFTIPADPEVYRVWLKERYPTEAEGIDKLFQKLYDIDKVMRIIFGYEYNGKDTTDPEVMMEMLGDIAAAGDNLTDVLMNDIQPLMEGITLTQFMKPYTENEELLALFTLLAGMAGEGPDAVDAIFFLAMWNQYHLGGFCYVHGGSQAISDALGDKIRDNNKIRLNTLVTKIDIDDEGNATQVRAADGTCYKTRYVISNANVPDTMFKMVGYKHLPTPEIDPEDPYTTFHPGRIWQPPRVPTEAAAVDTPNTDEVDQISGATPTVATAQLTDSHTGWSKTNCTASGCHDSNAHPVPGIGNNAAHYTDAQCTTCHGTNGSPVATSANHSSGTVNEKCGMCHGGVHDGLGYNAPTDCIACHKFNTESADVGDAPECVVTEEGYDVVIIGAGGGGLGAGAYLTEQGYNVIVLERHHKVGGYMTNFNRGDYRVEISTHGFDGLDPRPLVDWNVGMNE